MQRPSIFVYKCSGENCRTDEEIKSFLDNKELQVFVLAKSYNTTNYNPEEKLQRIATRYSIQLDFFSYKDVVITSSSESLETEDEFYSFGLISDNQKFYTVPQQPQVTLTGQQFGWWGEQMLTQIHFVLSSDITEHKRTIYGPLDFLGDVGGL